MLLKDYSCCTVKNRLENRTLKGSRLPVWEASTGNECPETGSIQAETAWVWAGAGGCCQGESRADGMALMGCLETLCLPTLPHHPEEAQGLTPSCRPGLEPPNTSLHPRQEAEALAGDAGTEAAVQGKQRLGAKLGPVLLQLLPARLLQQDLGADARAVSAMGVGPSCSSPEASASSLPARQSTLRGCPGHLPPSPSPSPDHPEGPPDPGLVPEYSSPFLALPAPLHTHPPTCVAPR